MAAKSLSLRGYAKYRKEQGLPGGTIQAVQRAVKSERITLGPDNRVVDPEAADREWAANTDRSRAPGWLKEMADGTDGEEVDGPTLSEASAREKHWKAELAELNYLERAGELVDATAIAAEYSNRCSVVRTRLLGIPSGLKQAHPDLGRDVLATLEALIRDGLAELARSTS